MSQDARLRHADVLSEVETRCPAGHDQVLVCHPLRQGQGRFEPFPTRFWLVCPHLVEALSRLEHGGWIHRLQERIAAEPDLREAVAADHRAYVAERFGALSEAERAEIRARGLEADFHERGIGGIRNWASVKCLHLHYAHHLARGSTLGGLLDEIGVLRPCPAEGAAR